MPTVRRSAVQRTPRGSILKTDGETAPWRGFSGRKIVAFKGREAEVREARRATPRVSSEVTPRSWSPWTDRAVGQERAAGMPSAAAREAAARLHKLYEKDADISANVAKDASGRHWDDGSLDDVRRRTAWYDYQSPFFEAPPVPHRVWNLSTGAQSLPPAKLTEFPSNTARRETPHRWYFQSMTVGTSTRNSDQIYVC